MSEERYNNRQIEKMLTDQSADIKEHIDLKIEPLTAQVAKTNGTVRWQTKMLYVAIGALPLLSAWMWIITQSFLDSQKEISPVQRALIIEAVNEAFKHNAKP